MSRPALGALEGYRLNVEVTGTGLEAVLALHGFTGNLSQWQPFAAAAGKEYRVVTVDLPGHGSSDAPDNPVLYDMDHTVRALAEVLDRLELPRAHWLGYSLGGRIAIGAAVTLPERTLSLATAGASPGLATEAERAARRESDEALARRIETKGITDFVDHWESLPLWKSQTRLAPETRRNLRARRLAANPTGLANSLRGIGVGSQPDFRHELALLGVPALFVAGAEDEKYTAIAREMGDLAAGSRVEIVPESGHAVYLEQPERFQNVVLAFLHRTARNFNATGSRSNP
jgi:2-succinyl-6-hydroxy-2,4-cyclohexadiene-1-carboxylate synthase